MKIHFFFWKKKSQFSEQMFSVHFHCLFFHVYIYTFSWLCFNCEWQLRLAEWRKNTQSSTEKLNIITSSFNFIFNIWSSVSFGTVYNDLSTALGTVNFSYIRSTQHTKNNSGLSSLYKHMHEKRHSNEIAGQQNILFYKTSICTRRAECVCIRLGKQIRKFEREPSYQIWNFKFNVYFDHFDV